MATLSSLIGGGSGGGVGRKYVDLIILNSSQSWSPRQDCKAVVTVIGGGGSGAVQTNLNRQARGGGAGGLAQSDIITLSSSTPYTATVGSGGFYVGISSTSASINGNSGGNSSFSGTGITTLTGNGGAGGAGGTGFGGAGGTASGGLYNYTGGSGGRIQQNYLYLATGGGAVNITGTAYSAGDTTYANGLATGGAGCGERSLLMGNGNTSFPYSSCSGGGGYDFGVIDFYYLMDTSLEGQRSFLFADTSSSSYGGQGMGYQKAPPLCGGFGIQASYGSDKAQNGGIFAGGGAIVGSTGNTSRNFSVAGNGGLYGGGGGACVNYNDASYDYFQSGAGGNGVIFIAVTEYL